MEVVGSEIGQKMRSAIKAKLTELGCYVDDELPDYVMVMVANKRTREQMEEDLQLFLGDNTRLFVGWLHQVLRKLQEVTIAPLKTAVETEKAKEKTKEKKSKEKKDKTKVKKTDITKKGKKKDKDKTTKKKNKEGKKSHKSKKKSKHEMIRPNVPPLLMNMEKDSEPSITDVFAGQILKNHGINLDLTKEEVKIVEKKPVVEEIKRPVRPIIDPATISTQPEVEVEVSEANQEATGSVSSLGAPREEQIKEMNEIEAKIQGLKQKLVEQLDTLSDDDEDFLNIRTEAEELMNDFAEDVFQEISSQAKPLQAPATQKAESPPKTIPKPIEVPQPILETPKPIEVPELPHIELNLPKRPIRERLGAKEACKAPEKESKRKESPERLTPEIEIPFWPSKSARSRLGPGAARDDDMDINKKVTSKVQVCTSVVRVRPRPRAAPSLLLRAVADAHRSLLTIPPKVDEPQKVKRALVRPMRRGDSSLLVQVTAEKPSSDTTITREEYIPISITKKIQNTDYVPTRRPERVSSRKDETLIIETINIHNTTVGKDKDTQFIVTMDGFNPNAFLAKKLMTEGLLNDDDDTPKANTDVTKSILKTAEENVKEQPSTEEKAPEDKTPEEKTPEVEVTEEVKTNSVQKKRLSNTSDESDTQVIIKREQEVKVEKRRSEENDRRESEERYDSPPVKKRRASPIVFDVGRKEKIAEVIEKEPQKAESVNSDAHVTVTTKLDTHKYDTLPSLSQASSKLVRCRAFPLCRYGQSCAFQHPRCKFALACTRRGCIYHHEPGVAPAQPAIASHVVPVANFKSIPAAVPNICKFYPGCVNPACHFYHPKPCRFGKACANKLECNFYHHDVPKYRYPV